MFILLMIVHILVCLWLIIVVLLQAGKGASLSGLFGGGMPETIFGGGGDTVLRKITAVSATIFMITSLSLYILSVKQEGTSIVKPVKENTAPVVSTTTTPTQSVPMEQAPAQSGTKPAEKK